MLKFSFKMFLIGLLILMPGIADKPGFPETPAEILRQTMDKFHATIDVYTPTLTPPEIILHPEAKWGTSHPCWNALLRKPTPALTVLSVSL